jgi:2-polyprenyl-6-methoxyphenol hydroxylase-like FAD-dependent oxidoreductase
MTVQYRADVVIAGGGLAGLATAHELLDRGLRVLILDRDSEDRLGAPPAEARNQ